MLYSSINGGPHEADIAKIIAVNSRALVVAVPVTHLNGCNGPEHPDRAGSSSGLCGPRLRRQHQFCDDTVRWQTRRGQQRRQHVEKQRLLIGPTATGI